MRLSFQFDKSRWNDGTFAAGQVLGHGAASIYPIGYSDTSRKSGPSDADGEQFDPRGDDRNDRRHPGLGTRRDDGREGGDRAVFHRGQAEQREHWQLRHADKETPGGGLVSEFGYGDAVPRQACWQKSRSGEGTA